MIEQGVSPDSPQMATPRPKFGSNVSAAEPMRRPFLLGVAIIVVSVSSFSCKQSAAKEQPQKSAPVSSEGLNSSSPVASAAPQTDSEDFRLHFKLVAGGSFRFGGGADGGLPIREVELGDFYMAETEVSLGEWRQVTDWARGQGYDLSSSTMSAGDDKPASNMDWYDAVKWCNARSEKAGLRPCYYIGELRGAEDVYRRGKKDLTPLMVDWAADGYRLPTEAEWEKAARGGLEGKRFPLGDELTAADANFSTKSAETVRSFRPNAFGLYEMAGNVWEWCWDWFGAEADGPMVDPKGPSEGERRVVRGGGWDDGPGACYVFFRNSGWPEYFSESRGFRLVRRLKG